MVKFNRLRLSGFKSFVEPTELNIQHGLTGIVGPNGCGKSNLVEALRWAMGETSAKRLRGSEMDDVIFAGSASRPSRNVAEVALELDNSDRTAPAGFNDHNDLEILRRIERGSGSNYRINGRDVRAKDVQLLFADSATGAHSTALVSQGRIGALINAKPTDRRSLLEEAAGITGLHSRRHEAELRLRAAETNLERLDDVISTLEAQHQSLKKQARQANRYRNLAAHIRRHEAILLYLDGQRAEAELSAAKTAFEQAQERVNELTGLVATASTEQSDAAADLPELRQTEAAAAAALQRLLVDRENLEREETQLAEAKARLETHLQEIEGDRQRAEALAKDASEALDRLAEESSDLEAAGQGEQDAISEAEAALQAARQAVAEQEETAARLSDQVAQDEARKAALERRLVELDQRLAKLREQSQRIAEATAALKSEDSHEAPLAEANAAMQEAQADLSSRREQAAQAAETLKLAREAESKARDDLQAATKAKERCEAEISALSKLLDSDQTDIWPPIVDSLTVEPGYEIALGAALGDDLSASANDAAPMHWDSLPPYSTAQSLPAGATALTEFVKAPNALARRLSQIGVVADLETGKRLQKALEPGQRLVTQKGDLWRWDGFATRSEAPTAAAKRMAQRNTLAELRNGLPALQTDFESTQEAHRLTCEMTVQATQIEAAARQAVDQAFTTVSTARDRQAELAERAAAATSRLASLMESAERLAGEIAESEAALVQANGEQGSLPDLQVIRGSLNESRAELAERRNQQSLAQNKLDGLRRESEARGQRLLAINNEAQSWQRRADEARQHFERLADRRGEAQAELDALAERPTEIAERRNILVDKIESAEAKRRQAADALAEGETRLAKADRELKGREQSLSEAREERVRSEAAVEQSQRAGEVLIERIRERLECQPEQVLELAELDPTSEDLPNYDQISEKLAKLVRERDNMGPVNLRAEQEATELDEQIKGLESERADLVAAIARLRQGIASLNREGRQRLLAAFDEVNGHFSELFVRLFGGGKAYLKLTEADDPLEAGLEVMASPPGKRLQVLSLLSGGEQALTALALLFAVFLTNPAPICVLDEVDAPLDDANVDRFCRLVEDLAERASTRFLIITHHRMTMARVDRLYGVTMAERGVSQLVSVDLESAEELRDTA